MSLHLQGRASHALGAIILVGLRGSRSGAGVARLIQRWLNVGLKTHKYKIAGQEKRG